MTNFNKKYYKSSFKDLRNLFVTYNRGSNPSGVDAGNAHILNTDCYNLLLDWL